MPTFYIPLAEGLFDSTAPGIARTGIFTDSSTGLPLAIPQQDAPSILQQWTILSIYAPTVIVTAGVPAAVNFQLGLSAIIGGTPVWAQEANGQLLGTPAISSQIVSGDLFNPLDLNAGARIAFGWQLAFDAAVTGGQIWVGAVYGQNGIQPARGVVNYNVAYHPALGRSAAA